MENRPTTDGPTQPMSPPPGSASVMEDMMEMFYAPTAVFARREKSGFWTMLLIVTVLSALFAYANRGVMSQIFDAEFQRATAKAMAANPSITMDQMNTMRGVQEKIAVFGSLIGTPIFIFILAFVTWLVAKVVSARVTYQQMVLIVSLAWLPRVLGSLVTTVEVLVTDTTDVTNPFMLTLSPARFIDAETANAKLFGLLGSLEPFSVWYAILVGIGISVMAKVPRSKGYTAAGIMFVIGMLPALMR